MATDTRRLAFDKASVRSYDTDGRMRVELTPISKANICPYKGDEIPNYEELGLDPSKIYRLYRDPEELKKAAKTSNGIPLQLVHKPTSADDHPRELTVGSVGTDAIFKAPYLMNSLTVWDGEGIAGIESETQKELSPGYHYVADMTPGEVDGEHCDGVMRDIEFNHLCLVEEGRTGSDVLVMDSAFKEGDHPRAENGQFGSGGGSGYGASGLKSNPDGSPSEKRKAFVQPSLKLQRSNNYTVKDIERAIKTSEDNEYRWSVLARRFADENNSDAENDVLDLVNMEVYRKVELTKILNRKKSKLGNDETSEDLKPMIKTATLTSRKAMLVQGVVAGALIPKLAQDAKIDIGPVFAGINRDNYAKSRATILRGVEKATKGKLAQDMDLADVMPLLDAMVEVDGGGDPDVDDDVTVDADITAGAADPPDPENTNKGGAEDGDDDDAKTERLKALGFDEEQCSKIMGAMSPPAADEDPAIEPGGKKDDEMKEDDKPVTKGAMDAAIRTAVADATKSATQTTIARMRSVHVARDAVKPHVGEVDVAMDSAESIYRMALDAAEVEYPKTLALDGLKAMVGMLPSPDARKPVTTVAMDAKTHDDLTKRFPGADRIRHA